MNTLVIKTHNGNRADEGNHTLTVTFIQEGSKMMVYYTYKIDDHPTMMDAMSAPVNSAEFAAFLGNTSLNANVIFELIKDGAYLRGMNESAKIANALLGEKPNDA